MAMSFRCILFIAGLFFASLGICLIIKGNLGTSPISSLPYVLSLYFPLSLGMFTFIVNMIMLLMQILLRGRKFAPIQLLQIPMTVIFSLFIDGIMALLNAYSPAHYGMEIAVILIGCAALGFGVTLEVIGNVVMLPGEGLVYSIADFFHMEFGKTKVAFDLSLVIISCILSLLFWRSIEGLREGTVISAFLVGTAARFFIKKCSVVDEHGALVFRWLPTK